MTERQGTIAAEAACAELMRDLSFKAWEGRVLSVFDRAANIDTPRGLVSLIAGGRSLQPYSVRLPLDAPLSKLCWKAGAAAAVGRTGIAVSGGGSVLLTGVTGTELSVYQRIKPATADALPAPDALLAALSRRGDLAGLSCLVTGAEQNVYAALIAPRLPALYAAAEAGDAAAAAQAASRIAGCGVGLTPSSDDLLSGYFTALHALSAAGGSGPVRTLTRAATHAAAEKTNRISGAFLIQSGEGLASEDVLTLLQSLFSGASPRELSQAAERVLSFGSTSGADLLTGIALAIIHHYGGNRHGKTGDQKERLF